MFTLFDYFTYFRMITFLFIIMFASLYYVGMFNKKSKLRIKLNLCSVIIQHKIHFIGSYVKNFMYYDCYMNYKKNSYLNHNNQINKNITVRKSMKPPSDIFKHNTID